MCQTNVINTIHHQNFGKMYRRYWLAFDIAFNPQSHLNGFYWGPMLTDPHPIQKHTGHQHAVF